MGAEKLKGIRVSHKKYGTGTVAGFSGELMEICFEEGGVKKFKYPDAFDRFLKIEERERLAEIVSEIEESREDEGYQARMHSRLVYEHIQEFGEERRLRFEKRVQEQIEKQRRMQKMREQKLQRNRQEDEKAETSEKAETDGKAETSGKAETDGKDETNGKAGTDENAEKDE